MLEFEEDVLATEPQSAQKGREVRRMKWEGRGFNHGRHKEHRGERKKGIVTTKYTELKSFLTSP